MTLTKSLKESKNWEKYSEMCNEIYQKEPSEIVVRLILALFFITQKDFVNAKSCLYYVEKSLPPEKTSKTYYHYLAKYYEETNDYSATGETGNFPADMDYLNLIRNTLQIQKKYKNIRNTSKFDYKIIKHLKSMLIKYEDNKNLFIHILLNLAIIYLFDAKNYKLAADYFLKENPCNPQLENFHTHIIPKKNYNIYELIKEKIFNEKNRNNSNALKELKNYYTDYKKRMETTNVPDSLETKFAEKLSVKKSH